MMKLLWGNHVIIVRLAIMRKTFLSNQGMMPARGKPHEKTSIDRSINDPSHRLRFTRQFASE